MKTEELHLLNLSCGGCVKTITKKLTAFSGVEKVDVNLETSTVKIQHDESVNRTQLSQLLSSIGYPEVKEKNGILTQLKSIKSCMTGKISE